MHFNNFKSFLASTSLTLTFQIPFLAQTELLVLKSSNLAFLAAWRWKIISPDRAFDFPLWSHSDFAAAFSNPQNSLEPMGGWAGSGRSWSR
jgi:hypothetical protein